MTQFFEHTPQATDVVNQVENLATEVNDAFNTLEEVLYQDDQKNASITSSIGDLDNKYIKDYVPNKGWISNYEQTLYFPDNSQSSSLDLYPSLLVEDLNTVSIKNITSPSTTYTYKHDGILTNNTDFSFVGRKVILGKSPTDSDSLVITYKGFNTTTPDDNQDWPFELRYNVLQIKQNDNSIIREFNVTNTGGVYQSSGYDFKSLCSVFIQNIINNQPQDLDKYVAIYNEEKRVDCYNIEITNTYVRFASETVITTPIKIYVANSSLGKLVECLYRLFYAHDHGDNGGQGVNHNDILGLYENTSNIHYQSTKKTNYDHPQYLNREGYIQDATVYNNGMLGDLLLTSISDGNRKNNLDANSVKLVFGEYNSGPRFYYNKSDDCLWLDSISRDGIKLVTPKEKKALSVNDHSFIDTQHLSSKTDNALKLTVKANNDSQLGVFKLTRKIRASDGTVTDDDKGLFLSYASEFSLSLIKEKLTINNGAKITFGDPGIIDLILDDTGLHFKTEGDGTVTDVSTVHFDIPVKANNIEVNHLDAKSVHLTETQKITFGIDNHTEEAVEYINYKDSKLNIKTKDSVVVVNNGRKTGLSLDDRQYIYTSTPQGFPILDKVEYTDLFVETKRDTYFIQNGYTFTPGITSLHSVPRSSIYCDNSNVNNVKIVYNENTTNGLVLNNNNKVFAQRDLSDNISTIMQSNNGVIIAASYSPVGPTINYGKITAKTYIAEGNKDTDSGFYGNIIVPLNNRLTINGTTEFNSDIIFNKQVTFTEKVIANNLDAQVISTNELNVSDKATYNNVEVLEELRFNTLLQTNRVANSEFEGTVQFNNNVTVPDSNNFILLGNKEIEDKRTVSGLYLSNSEVRLGTNGVVSAGKLFAGKGTPSGNGDTTGGYSFASTNGQSDGDTGLFCEENIEEQSNSDLVFRVDGVEKGRLLKEDIDLSAIDLTGKEKALITLDILLDQIKNITVSTLERTYPIGTVYENSVDGRNPAIIFEWPTSVWRRYAVGRSLMGASGNGVGEQVDDYLTVPAGLNTNAAGSKFGDFSSKNKLPITGFGVGGNLPQVTERGKLVVGSGNYENSEVLESLAHATTGAEATINIIHPIIITHIWERIG